MWLYLIIFKKFLLVLRYNFILCTFGEKIKVDVSHAVLSFSLNILFRLIGTRVEKLLTD